MNPSVGQTLIWKVIMTYSSASLNIYCLAETNKRSSAVIRMFNVTIKNLSSLSAWLWQIICPSIKHLFSFAYWVSYLTFNFIADIVPPVVTQKHFKPSITRFSLVIVLKYQQYDSYYDHVIVRRYLVIDISVSQKKRNFCCSVLFQIALAASCFSIANECY